jgi:hypothetical protein
LVQTGLGWTGWNRSKKNDFGAGCELAAGLIADYARD